jgi:dTDP-4-dehydrorhamnose 3,5-epimerase
MTEAFFESYNKRVLHKLGLADQFVQDNHSRSKKAVLRGLHYQIRQPQGKLVRVVVGEIFDVAVDIRRRSPSFGKWVSRRLSSENKEMLWVPPGFAHGFLVLSDLAEVAYKTTDYYPRMRADNCMERSRIDDRLALGRKADIVSEGFAGKAAA